MEQRAGEEVWLVEVQGQEEEEGEERGGEVAEEVVRWDERVRIR